MQSEEDIYSYWFEKRDLSKSTQTLYRSALSLYARINNKTLVEIYNEGDNEEETNIKLDKRKYSFYTLKFKKYLIDNGKSPHTIRVYINAVKSFYHAFNIREPDVKVAKGDLVLEQNYGYLLKKEDIIRLMNVADSRNRAIICTMALSGMSQKEVRTLKIEKLIDSINRSLNLEISTIEELIKLDDEVYNNEIIMVEITRGKVHYRYQTFFPPEVIRNIIIYLRERQLGTNRNIKSENIHDNLFVRKDGEQLSKVNMAFIFSILGQKAGFKHSKKGAYRPWRSHGMRKYFISTIINNTGDHIMANYMAGHKIDSVTRSYWFADPEKLKEKYLTALPYLSLENTEVQIITSKDRQELDILRNEVQEMRETLREHNIQRLNELPTKR